jgi:hypothetical protein
VAQAAVLALTEYGNGVVGTLGDYLADGEEDIRLRRLLPDVLARIGTQRAADTLLAGFRKSVGGLEAELVEAMSKIKASRPAVAFGEAEVLRGVLLHLRAVYADLDAFRALRAARKKEIRARELELVLFRSMKSVFALLGLIYPPEDIRKAQQNLLAGTKKAIDYSVELLDNLLRKDIKPFLLPLLEDMSLEEKAKSAGRALKALDKALAS